MSSFKSMKTFIRNKMGFYVVSANKALKFLWKRGQIIKNLSRIWVQTNYLFLISQHIHADLKGPKIKYKLHYGWCKGGRFTAATLHSTSCNE